MIALTHTKLMKRFIANLPGGSEATSDNRERRCGFQEVARMRVPVWFEPSHRCPERNTWAFLSACSEGKRDE